METSQNPLRLLAELLSGRAKPVITPERLAASATYDLAYRMAVTSLTFRIHAKAEADAPVRIAADRLKLFQFIAQRPWLVVTIRSWAESRKDAQLSMLSSDRLRRGYLGDVVHDRVVSFMVARGILAWNGKYLVAGSKGVFIEAIYSEATQNQLFTSELRALDSLRSIRITNEMLGEP
jgi:hypothetical protein